MTFSKEAFSMAADFRSILRQVRQEVPEIDANTLHEQMEKNDDLILVDVREGEEFRQGHIVGAEHCARGFLEMKIGDTCHNTAGNIVLY